MVLVPANRLLLHWCAAVLLSVFLSIPHSCVLTQTETWVEFSSSIASDASNGGSAFGFALAMISSDTTTTIVVWQ
jgi:hypothetical protein